MSCERLLKFQGMKKLDAFVESGNLGMIEDLIYFPWTLIIMWWQLSFSAVCYTVARPLTVTITLWWHWYRVMRVAREIAWNVLKVEILIGRMIHCSLCSYTFVFSSVKKWYMKDITGYRNKRQWTQHCTNCQCSDPNVNMKQVLIFMLR